MEHGGVKLSGTSVDIARQSSLVFVECWGIFATWDGRIMELEKASLPLAIGFGCQCQCQRLVVAVVVQKITINKQQQCEHSSGSSKQQSTIVVEI